MDEFDITGGEAGIDRRDFIRKSALVGGMVWAAPIVSSIGSPAFAITGTGTPGGSPDPSGSISYVAFIVTNAGSGAWKYEFDSCPGDVIADLSPGNTPDCNNQPYTGNLPLQSEVKFETFEEARNYANSTPSIDVQISTTCPEDGEEWVFTIVTEGYFFDSGVVKSARICADAIISEDRRTLTAQPIESGS